MPRRARRQAANKVRKTMVTATQTKYIIRLISFERPTKIAQHPDGYQIHAHQRLEPCRGSQPSFTFKSYSVRGSNRNRQYRIRIQLIVSLFVPPNTKAN